MTNPKRAYYSPTAAEKYGSSIYRNAEGSEAEVTCVEPGLEDTGIYKWEDAEVVGLVTEFIRKGQEGEQAQLIRATSPSFLLRANGPYEGVRNELSIVRLDALATELWKAMRPKPPSLKKQAASELVQLREEMKRHGLDVPATPALIRALKSIPDANES